MSTSPAVSSSELDTPALRLALQELVAVHYLGCDTGDLELATSMMLPDVCFTLPPLGQRFDSPAATRTGLAQVITKLPRMFRHRPAGFRFVVLEQHTLRATFTTHIMSCVDGSVHAIGDITVNAVLRDGALRVSAWEVRPIFFRGLIHGGRLAWLPRLFLTIMPFALPADVRALFAAAASGGR
jgi:SnoaL-like domain